MNPSTNRYTAASRKPHRKSRLGCGNCKRRRVKCDEAKPACTNCLRHSIDCDYQSGHSVSRNASPSVQNAGLELRLLPRRGFTFYSSSQSDFETPKRGNGAHKKEQQERPPSVTSSRDMPSNAPSNTPPDTPFDTPSELTTTAFEFTGADMELFHHFLTSEELGASKSPETMHSRLPRLGFSFHYILHLILAFSGFHLARIQKHEPKYYLEAERNYATALRMVSAAVPLLDNNNCHALYVAAILIFVCSFAKEPQPDEFLAFRDDGSAGSLSLLMGVRSILENCSAEVLKIHSEHTKRNSQPSSPCYRVSGYSNQVEQLRILIAGEVPIDDNRYLAYINVLDRLHHCFDSIYGRQSLTDGDLWPQIFGWLYTLPDDFVVDLQHRNPVTLVIFAFYAVLLKRISSVWLIRGWPEHIMGGIQQFVHEEYRPFIQWPMEQLK